MASTTADPNPAYWSEYTNLQRVKHALIRNYLSGWFPKLTLGPWGEHRLVYIDTHAGRGKHLRGHLGSPLVALNALLEHKSRDRILQRTEVRFCFVERDDQNVAALQKELEGYPLPKNVFVHAEAGDSFEIIDRVLKRFESEGSHLAPSFVFVDPYGFKLPGGLLRRLISQPKTELFVNVIWRELDMAIASGRKDPTAAIVKTLDRVFDGDWWRQIDSTDDDERAERCAELFRGIAGAQWGTCIRMLDRNRIRYFLLHLTNHDAGRDLMKDCIWNACPDGGYYASRSDNPAQKLLIRPEPDLASLREWVTARLSVRPRYWLDLTHELREELWLGKHLNEVVRTMRADGTIIGDQYTGRFAQKNNPRLRLARDAQK